MRFAEEGLAVITSAQAVSTSGSRVQAMEVDASKARQGLDMLDRP